ncbi:MAG: SDR family NAD(P)-dependent oxidoreductase [Sphingomonadales bacterium]
MTDPYLKNRIALVTGATRGIGWATSVALAKAGVHVIALGRTSEKLEELDDQIRKSGGTATLVPLDLRDFDGIDRLGASIMERWGKLDILIGNAAALGPLSPVGHISPAEWDQMIALNLTANWRLIRSMDALLKASDAGRAIFVTSGAANKTTPFWGGYGTSKIALEHIVKTWAAECGSKSSLKINLINPGPIRTAMRAKAMPGENAETLILPSEIAPLFLKLSSPKFKEQGQIINYLNN